LGILNQILASRLFPKTRRAPKIRYLCFCFHWVNTLVHLIFLIVAILDATWGNSWRRNRTNRNDSNLALPKICYMSIYVDIFNIDVQQFNQYQQNYISPQIIAHKKTNHMPIKIQYLAWDRHKNIARLNRLMGSLRFARKIIYDNNRHLGIHIYSCNRFLVMQDLNHYEHQC
jgi:hypothetical protein